MTTRLADKGSTRWQYRLHRQRREKPIRIILVLYSMALMRASWSCVYPLYFDSGRSMSEGRRVPKAMAVVSPSCQLVELACAPLGLDVAVEVRCSRPMGLRNLLVSWKSDTRGIHSCLDESGFSSGMQRDGRLGKTLQIPEACCDK